MTSRGIISEEPPRMCEMCGTIEECRPYGPNDEQICLECAMLDKATTERKMAVYIFGDTK